MSQKIYFKVLSEQDHDGSFKVWAPALPACQVSGVSILQARERIAEAIRCHCLNMLENGAAIPETTPGRPTVVDEVQISLGAA